MLCCDLQTLMLSLVACCMHGLTGYAVCIKLLPTYLMFFFL
jgi:hypothetical protein